MTFDIKGKHCIVTGAATGIGLCYVKELLKHGAAHVCILDMNPVGTEVARQLNKEMGTECCTFYQTDVTNAQQFEANIKSCISLMKGLDIFINNAGMLNDLKWELEVALNVNSVIRGTLIACNHMARDQGGRGGVIVNIASILGLSVIAGCPIYCATKHAVLGMSRAWGMPFHYNRTGVKVLTMCPGVTDTPLISEAHGVQLGSAVGIECQRELDSLPKQPPTNVAKGMMHMITKGESGSVWVSEGNQPIYEVEIPDRLTLRKKH